MFCRFCGKEIQGQKAFCPYCGKQLTQQSAQQASVPVQRPQNSLAKKKRRFWPVLVWLLLAALLVVGAAGVLAYYEILEIPVISDVVDMMRDDRADRPVKEDDDMDDEADEPEETTAEQTEILPESEATAQTEPADTTPTETPTLPEEEVPTMAPNPLAELEVGDDFNFGCFEQDNNSGNGAEDVKWLVLDKQPGMILVVTKYGLDCQKFHTESESATWETCTIRTWLNDEFYEDAFDSEEKSLILDTTVTPDENPNYNTYAGVATVDKVFLLSYYETVSYMPDNNARFCMPTAYAVGRNAYAHPRSGGCWWLLRTPGNKGNHVMSINCDGSIDFEGGVVESDRAAVRPAMWISTD